MHCHFLFCLVFCSTLISLLQNLEYISLSHVLNISECECVYVIVCVWVWSVWLFDSVFWRFRWLISVSSTESSTLHKHVCITLTLWILIWFSHKLSRLTNKFSYKLGASWILSPDFYLFHNPIYRIHFRSIFMFMFKSSQAQHCAPNRAFQDPGSVSIHRQARFPICNQWYPNNTVGPYNTWCLAFHLFICVE